VVYAVLGSGAPVAPEGLTTVLRLSVIERCSERGVIGSDANRRIRN
jgi:hypothetical protein